MLYVNYISVKLKNILSFFFFFCFCFSSFVKNILALGSTKVIFKYVNFCSRVQSLTSVSIKILFFPSNLCKEIITCPVNPYDLCRHLKA